MGNSSIGFVVTHSCKDDNISRSSITPEYWDSAGISEAYKVNSFALAVIMLIFLLIGLPANATIIVTIIYRKLYKETTYILLLNLAISDFLVCLLVLPFQIIAGFAGGYIFGESDYRRCQVCQAGLILTALTVFSINMLAFMSIDRFVFIKINILCAMIDTLQFLELSLQ